MDFKKEGCYLALRKRLFAFLKILYHELFEIMELNLLFLLLCIPVVTIPPVCAAMSKVTLCMVRQKEYSLRKTFWPTFRQSFGKSLLGGGALILGQLSAGYGMLFYYQLLETPIFYIPFLLTTVLAVLLTAAELFLFPLIATVDLPLLAILKNAVLLPMLYPCRILAALLLIGLLTATCILLIPYTAPVILLLLFSVSSLIAAAAVSHGVQRCEVPEGRN